MDFFIYFWRCLSISKKTLINEEIKSSEVRVVDAEGKQLGILRIEQALRLAYEEQLDLVEIAPEAKPPVCKIMDYGKYRFEKEKHEKEIKKKQQIIELKELQLNLRIDTHDFNTKLNHATRFLTQGNKVKVVVKFKGREMAHPEKGTELLERFAGGCGELCVIEKQPLLDGRNMIMILAPKKTNNAAANTSAKSEAKPAEEKPAADKSQT
jgi:translation initiation factor IF-3